MTKLDPDHQQQIEELLGRPLTVEELAQVNGLETLNDAQMQVVRTLAARQAALCSVYLRSITAVSVSATKIFIDKILATTG